MRHLPGVVEVVAHEAFHSEHAAAIGDPPLPRHAHLLVAGEIVGTSSGVQVEIDAQRHQKIGCFSEPLCILPGECLGHSRRCRRRFAGLNELQPAHQLDVAQPPWRPLHIRLQERHALPVAFPFLPPGLKQARHEALRHAAGHPLETG